MGQYIGARYVPKFMGTYDATQDYENLCVVDNGLGTSYITKIPTPAGTPLTDTDYWAVYGASSGAIINLQNQIDGLSATTNDLKGGMYKTLYDYGYDNEADITSFVQAFIDDASALALNMQMTGNYTLNALTLSSIATSKRFIKSANTIISGTGASQIYFSGDDEIDTLYAKGIDQFPKGIIRVTDNDTSPYRVMTNLYLEDHVLNANDPHYHWNILAISDLHTSGGGSNVCEYLQVRNHGDSNNWAICIESVMDAAISGTETGSSIGIELLLKGKGTVSPNGGSRIGMHLISAAHDATGYDMNYGILFESSSNNTSHGFIDAIHFRNVKAESCFSLAATCTTNNAIDLHDATINNNAIWAGFEHPIKFDNWSVREAYTSGIKTLVFEDGINGTVFELTHLESATADSPTPVKYMRVFYNNTQYCIPLYAY